MVENRGIGIRIRGMRKALGIKQADLAKAVGVTRTTVSRWESGDIEHIPFPTLVRVGEVLNVISRWLALGDVPPGRAYYPTPEEMTLLLAFASLSEGDQDKVMSLVNSLAKQNAS